jgi:hypothetical protein
MSQLAQDGLVEVVLGHGFRVVAVPATEPPVKPVDSAMPTPGPDRRTALLDLVLRHRGQVVSRFSAEADPDDSADLTDLTLSAIQRSSGDAVRATEYELEVRRSAVDDPLRTFVVTTRRSAGHRSRSSAVSLRNSLIMPSEIRSFGNDCRLAADSRVGPLMMTPS